MEEAFSLDEFDEWAEFWVPVLFNLKLSRDQLQQLIFGPDFVLPSGASLEEASDSELEDVLETFDRYVEMLQRRIN